MPSDGIVEAAPPRALAWSEWLLDRLSSADGSPALALWLPAGVTVALGLSQSPERELVLDAVARDRVGVVRRQSGGGAVVLYRGVLCWEAVSPVAAMVEAEGEAGIRKSYEFLSRPVITALNRLGLGVHRAGVCDLSLDWRGTKRKVAGTAQLRRRDAVLVHGSLLVDPDLELLSRYLRLPDDQPDYRRGRSHRDFCASVAEILEDMKRPPPTIAGLAGMVAAEVAELGWKVLSVPERLPDAAALLERRKYLSDGWNWERRRDLLEGG